MRSYARRRSRMNTQTGLQMRALKFQSSSSKFPRARTCELVRARSRLYRSQILQVNTRWKALAEIYTMHSFAPFWNPQSKIGEKRTWPKRPRKGENERPLISSSLPSTSAKGGCEEKLTRMKIEYGYALLCTVL